MAVAQGRLWVLSHGALLELGPDLSLRAAWSHPTLADAHQLCVWGEQLVVVSTAFDSLLAFDPGRGCFTWGCVLRGDPDALQVQAFDPGRAETWPRARDSVHLNQVHAADGALWTSGLRLPYLARLDDAVEAVAPLPWAPTTSSRAGWSALSRHGSRPPRARGSEALQGIAVPRQTQPAHPPRGRPQPGRLCPGPGGAGRRSGGGDCRRRRCMLQPVDRSVDRRVAHRDAREAVHGLCRWPATAVPEPAERSAAARWRGA